MSASQDSPHILRPIPRRPFNINLMGPTPPEDEGEAQEEQSQPEPPPPHPPARTSGGGLNLDSLNRRLLDPREGTPRFDSLPGSPSTSISRAQSYLNLTSSTLFGIYSPTTYGKDRFYADQDEPSTPWGTGAETPAKKLRADEPMYEVQKERGRHMRRRSSLHPPQRPPPLSRPAVVFHVGIRGLLLFGLGMLYGALVARFQDSHRFRGLQIDEAEPPIVPDARYLAFWGVSGVVMGALLPWFDGVWEGVFGQDDETESAVDHSMGSEEAEDSPQGTDWSLAIRGIGAFVGIVFALRKLQWTSTLQVSLALALVNPCLWYLIDRSKPGFLLSAAVGLAGSAILLGLKPDMVPTPAGHGPFDSYATNASATPLGSSPTMILGGLASQETVETGIWMLSILFCCCVCFGNIGRRLAMNQSGTIKGRWAEQKAG
ncbi:uncharacterized protein JN550_000002 [Neoarthrinium moseri]|uniref:uncharacterized protein n=1 Tax=Neoarthrinium moseri TaxID=1658444 RepID=UPI001FDB4757|nr:uncharacterized protein JN550_000002 [Neoarthrinium moseri]KAI1877820.1 hypothetical protein JN550_000002 [Neoarthrinium moseri]